MAKRIQNTGHALRKIRNTGRTLRPVKPSQFADAIGAEDLGSQGKPGGWPVSLAALREAIQERLHSKGGRPSLRGTTRRQKIPLTETEWTKLRHLAARLAQANISATPGQVASVLLHRALQEIDESLPVSEPVED